MFNSEEPRDYRIYISNENGENPREIEGVRRIEATIARERMHEEDAMSMLIARAGQELADERVRRMRVHVSDEVREYVGRDNGMRQLQETIEREMIQLSERHIRGEEGRGYERYDFEASRGRQVYKSWHNDLLENLLKAEKYKLPMNNREAVKLLEPTK